MVSQHALHVVSQHALQVSRGAVVSHHALQVSRPTPRGELEGSGRGGFFRPTPRGELEGSDLGGGVSRPTPRGVSRPTPGRGCIPACTESDPPSRRLLLWAVRILLECILVPIMFSAEANAFTSHSGPSLVSFTNYNSGIHYLTSPLVMGIYLLEVRYGVLNIFNPLTFLFTLLQNMCQRKPLM